ncbi:MAG: AAC(3) family N-acetyltransferase [Anaerolineales bacterium]|nr:AAC(3) family N-acetyltransferase [Anaerolineales bacterium]MCB8937837.1 AAC(3) family N-acetyltransferase [Ardenticatenaceae bacterium]
MTETAVIQNSPHPFTKDILVEHLRALGVQPGMTVLVHSSMSKIGYVPGGAVAVIQALQEALTGAGTLVMPTFSTDYSDPAPWQHPPAPEEWHQIIRDSMPAFDPLLTPTRMMGAVPELFRTWPGVFRSNHPQDSFAAWGHHAAAITADHQLENGLGEGSPLARIYELDGYVLLLGVSYGNNSSFHLSEGRAGVGEMIRQGSPIWQNGRRVWQWFDSLDYDDDSFPQIGAEFEQVHPVQIGKVGLAECRLFHQKTAVDFATDWLKNQAK